MSDELPLQSFEVHGYRGIRHLALPRLGNVNLFVGLNNAGKTSLLEAVHLYTSKTPRVVLASILRDRSGFRPRFSSDREVTAEQVTAALDTARSLFYGTFAGSVGEPIKIGPAGGDGDALTIWLPWAATNGTGEAGDAPDLELFIEPDSPLIQMSRGENTVSVSVDWFLRRFGVMITGTQRRTSYIPAQGLDAARLGEMWDQTVEAGYAPEVEQAIRSVVPELERIYLIGEAAAGGRSLYLQLQGTPRPMPLTSMGDGTTRVFGIALSCVRARGGALLVDEVENGLHHTIQPDVWQSIIGLAEQLSVQVFATTHSWDAVVGFQFAATNSAAHGMLYRLEREADGGIYAEQYTEKDVAVAARAQVEVR
jgi:hypothetical protein